MARGLVLAFAARSSHSRTFVIAAAIVAALTAAEAGWFVVYTIAEETQPAIWVVPLVSTAAMLIAVLLTGSQYDATPEGRPSAWPQWAPPARDS